MDSANSIVQAPLCLTYTFVFNQERDNIYIMHVATHPIFDLKANTQILFVLLF